MLLPEYLDLLDFDKSLLCSGHALPGELWRGHRALAFHIKHSILFWALQSLTVQERSRWKVF